MKVTAIPLAVPLCLSVSSRRAASHMARAAPAPRPREIPGVRNDMEVMESEAKPVAPRREIESRDRNGATRSCTDARER